MSMIICVNGSALGCVRGCEAIGEAWEKAKQLANVLGVDCSLIDAETGEIVAFCEI